MTFNFYLSPGKINGYLTLVRADKNCNLAGDVQMHCDAFCMRIRQIVVDRKSVMKTSRRFFAEYSFKSLKILNL